MLPKDLLIKRIRNELQECRRIFGHTFIVSDMDKFPIEIEVILYGVAGPIMEGEIVKDKFVHKFKIIIGEDYPYRTPAIRWKSDIFHPNIMPPEEGGYVCTKLIERWNFKSNLVSLIKGIETLLSSPNPKNPFETETCTKAAEYFNKQAYTPSERKKPIVIDENG